MDEMSNGKLTEVNLAEHEEEYVSSEKAIDCISKEHVGEPHHSDWNKMYEPLRPGGPTDDCNRPQTGVEHGLREVRQGRNHTNFDKISRDGPTGRIHASAANAAAAAAASAASAAAAAAAAAANAAAAAVTRD